MLAQQNRSASGTPYKLKESGHMIGKLIKFFIGLVLIPACLGISIATYHIFFSQLAILREQLWFCIGFAAYVLIYNVLQNPIKTYVFGHELTHALWTWLLGGKVMSFNAGSSSGSVTVSKSNVFISLAPYFFPLYTALAIAAYLILRSFWKVEGYFEVYRFVLGFTWAFHLVLTIYVLLKGQEDVKENGAIFSAFFIYLTNVLIFGLLWVYLTDTVTLQSYFYRTWDQIGLQYARILSFSRF